MLQDRFNRLRIRRAVSETEPVEKVAEFIYISRKRSSAIPDEGSEPFMPEDRKNSTVKCICDDVLRTIYEGCNLLRIRKDAPVRKPLISADRDRQKPSLLRKVRDRALFTLRKPVPVCVNQKVPSLLKSRESQRGCAAWLSLFT